MIKDNSSGIGLLKAGRIYLINSKKHVYIGTAIQDNKVLLLFEDENQNLIVKGIGKKYG